jgi:membrane fusion protein, heavy metal efflux system
MAVGARKAGRVWFWMLGLLIVGAAAAAVAISTTTNRGQVAAATPPLPTPSLRLVPGSNNKLELSPQLIQSLGVRTAVVESAKGHDQLRLNGSLFLDSNRMVRVHSRFAGEVVSVAEHKPDPSDTEQTLRPLRLGDHVTKGQLLAVIWSKDVGEKKSDLVNALSKLYLDTAQLDNLRSLPKNSVAGQQVREAIRERESDVIEVDRVERTLRSWRLTEAEIKAVRAEAEKIHSGDESNDLEVDKSWAEVEVRSPFDGVVLEKNIVAGDIVDTSLDLFRIADLNVLGVIANVYEEDLPALEALPPDRRRWTVNLKSQSASKGIDGSFELIGNIVDPNQHTAAVMGWLDNRDGRLRAGQFITASVQLPASEGEVVVPDTAIIQDGGTCVVFVAGDERGGEVTRRQVALASRGQNMAYIRSEPSPDEQAKGCECLKAGERVVIAGSIELEGALENALASTDLPSVNR